MTITVFRIGWVNGAAVDGPPEVVQVEHFGYPHCDADGRAQYENTHFLSERAAWDALLANVRAGQKLSVSEYERCQKQLAYATERLAKDAATRTRLESQFEDWERAR